MATNGINNEELVILPPNVVDMRTTVVHNNNINNNNNQAFNVRDHLIYAFFYKATLAYARLFPRSLRIFIEFVFLLMAVLSFFVLVYVHMNFSRIPANCLDHVKNDWPRHGILRVEIIQPEQWTQSEDIGTIDDLFTVDKSYEREYKLKQQGTNDENSIFASLLFSKLSKADIKAKVGIEPSPDELDGNKYQLDEKKRTDFMYDNFTPLENSKKGSPINTDNLMSNRFVGNTSFSIPEQGSLEYSQSAMKMMTGINYTPLVEPTSSPSPSHGKKEVKYIDIYIVEYSLEYGFLCMSPKTRKRLNIPVLLVPLDPTRNKCFGDSLGQFFLEYFLGYDDILMSSVKSLAEMEQNKGFLRNAITGEYFKFVSIWMSRSSYIASFLIMVVFKISSDETVDIKKEKKLINKKRNLENQRTKHSEIKKQKFENHFVQLEKEVDASYSVLEENSLKLKKPDVGIYNLKIPATQEFQVQCKTIEYEKMNLNSKKLKIFMLEPINYLVYNKILTVSISMLLRYSLHHIFVFIVDSLQLLDFHGSITLQAVPLLTVILALVGMVAIMSEFFNDTTTAFYIILIVWVADQYDTICSHCPITKRHWLKFFYLYHFSFYGYHYRFNGQYSNLALICSWLFTQHSMIYFYYHYELPFVLQQAQLQQVLIQRQQQQRQSSGGVDTRRPDVVNPLEGALRPARNVGIWSGLNSLGRFRAMLLRRRLVRTSAPPPPPPPPRSSVSGHNTSPNSAATTAVPVTANTTAAEGTSNGRRRRQRRHRRRRD